MPDGRDACTKTVFRINRHADTNVVSFFSSRMSHWTIFHAGDYPRQNDGVPLEILDGGRCCFTVSLSE